MTGFMVNILLILTALLLAVVGMVYFIATSGNRKTLCLRLAVLLCLGGLAHLAWEAYARHYARSLVPAAIHTTALEYNYEDILGIGGPGDNEQILRVFGLESDQAQRISQQGLPYLNALDSNLTWQATPWPDAAKYDKGKTGKTHIPITGLINSFDAGTDEYRVELDAKQAQLAERMLYSPDSYYTYRGYAALLVINPKEEKLLYLVFN